ncbi:MAG: phosphate ABC transporter permease subunit PstC [Bacteroidetes bacterium]|nr:MAG: phosphate ABC transporter permease subunit PstC [Bacteroidota bacterium]
MKSYTFTKESLRKKFRLSEFLSEKIITGFALLSITIIILIFVFVFRETIPLFTSKERPTGSREELVQEQYGVVPEPRPDQLQRQEVYGIEPDSALMGNREYSTEEHAAGQERRVTVKGLLGDEWYPVSSNPRYGLIPLMVGTIKITLIAMLFAAPIAILAALFSSAFAPTWLREWIKPAIELLAGFPSVVIGFFALMVMATVLQELFGYETRLNAFVGGIAMALAAIPIIYTITEDALTAIPGTYKEASLALGASKWQTALFVTLPAATPGVFAAILLGIGRVFGETMIALMATGNAGLISANPFESVRTLAATIGAEMAEVVFGDTHYGVLFLIGSLLFVFTFSLNALAEFYIKGRLMKRIQGKIA